MKRTPIVRKILFAFLALAGLAGIVIYPQTAAAISLNENAFVEKDVVRLGDVFTGLSSGEEKILGPAPLPGKQMVLDSRTLLRIALAMDLPWRPSTSADYVVLKRAATIVDPEMIDATLKSSLEEKGLTGEYKIVIDEEPGQMILPRNTEPGVEIMSINYKPERSWFEADLAAPSKANPLATAHVSGRIERMTKVPVLRETMKNGTIIGERDIDYISIPVRNLKSNVIADAAALIGMTPRQVTVAGQPVSDTEIEAPRIVQRGEVVTMVFNEGGLSLTAQGKALEHGAKGDRIRVQNVSSARTVIAQVSNVKEVTLVE